MVDPGSFEATKRIVFMRIESTVAVLAAGDAPLLGGVPAVTEAFANGHDYKFDDGVYSL